LRDNPFTLNGVHVTPTDPFDDTPRSEPAPPSNPFAGSLFDTDSPAVGRESTEFLDEVNFNSPKIGAGRSARDSGFIFQDLEDDEDLYERYQDQPTSRYTTVRVAEDHGLEEDDEFLDEKRKPQPSKFDGALSFPRKVSRKIHTFHDKYPRSTKAGLIILISLIPLFLLAFIILVIIATAGFRDPTVYSTNALETSALEAGTSGFNFTRALNLTMINKSPMTIDVEFIEVDINLARIAGSFEVFPLYKVDNRVTEVPLSISRLDRTAILPISCFRCNSPTTRNQIPTVTPSKFSSVVAVSFPAPMAQE
jgi:hypothetical protein